MRIGATLIRILAIQFEEAIPWQSSSRIIQNCVFRDL